MLFIETWAGRLERSQDIMFTTMDRASDRVSEYLEWPIEQWWKLVKTVRGLIFVSTELKRCALIVVENGKSCSYSL